MILRRQGLLALLAGLLLISAGAARGEEPARPAPPADPPPYGGTPENLVPFHRTPEPYRRFYLDPLLHRGPGRETPEPRGLDSVRIGLLAPLQDGPNFHLGRSLRRGVEMALEEANAAGGYRGIPFELRARHDQALWGASSNTLVEMAYHEKVWVLIGSPDSNSTHVALRATLKAELPMVNVASTDPTMTETGIPWLIRITPDDRQTGYRLAALLFEERGYSRVALLRSGDRNGRFGVKEFRDAARRLGRPLPMEIQFPVGTVDFSDRLERLEAASPQAVVLWAGAVDGARALRQMRARGMRQPVFGTQHLAYPLFLTKAGEAAEGVILAVWMEPGRSDPLWASFRRQFQELYGHEPDALAAYGYDAARISVEAIRQAGLNRVRIRDYLTSLRSYQGVAGPIVLDPTSNSIAPAMLARVEGGRLVRP